ncbi:MAG: hypothetical protein FRX48_09389 [Lasallia pustulata]|uniref:gamma-glutamylcyclotransferase n=1 Tax=Lasallia pustulata TaxID=136370 RepID=A0A5M8PCC4_9LECA|nr:MAG: hypothetical protein FRX48_09389 [Lasallia pustulata]
MGSTSRRILTVCNPDVATTTDTSKDLSTAPQTTYYFGYGSNLWLDQMRRRCPSSNHIGIAILHDWKWIICDRGYANVIPSPGDSVWGMVYILSAHDEAYLDRNEGVPTIYQKKLINIDFMPKNGCGVDRVTIEGLVYVDVERTRVAAIEEEYVYRMNQGIRDAVQMGMPEEYVARCLRPFIPTEDPPGAGEVVDPFAVR